MPLSLHLALCTGIKPSWASVPSSSGAQGQGPHLIRLCIPGTKHGAWHAEGTQLLFTWNELLLQTVNRYKYDVSSCWLAKTGRLPNAQEPSWRSFGAILFYWRTSHKVFLSPWNVGKARNKHTEEKVACVQCLECAYFYSLELVTWFELVTSN